MNCLVINGKEKKKIGLLKKEMPGRGDCSTGKAPAAQAGAPVQVPNIHVNPGQQPVVEPGSGEEQRERQQATETGGSL